MFKTFSFKLIIFILFLNFFFVKFVSFFIIFYSISSNLFQNLLKEWLIINIQVNIRIWYLLYSFLWVGVPVYCCFKDALNFLTPFMYSLSFRRELLNSTNPFSFSKFEKTISLNLVQWSDLICFLYLSNLITEMKLKRNLFYRFYSVYKTVYIDIDYYVDFSMGLSDLNFLLS